MGTNSTGCTEWERDFDFKIEQLAALSTSGAVAAEPVVRELHCILNSLMLAVHDNQGNVPFVKTRLRAAFEEILQPLYAVPPVRGDRAETIQALQNYAAWTVLSYDTRQLIEKAARLLSLPSAPVSDEEPSRLEGELRRTYAIEHQCPNYNERLLCNLTANGKACTCYAAIRGAVPVSGRDAVISTDDLINMFLSAGYDDKKAGNEAFDNFSPIKFFEMFRSRSKS